MFDFDKLIKSEKYQVFLLICPANLPFSFAIHPWFVINRKGIVSRWEVSFEARKRELSWGHLNKNLFPPFQGIEVFPFSEKYFWTGKVSSSIEGEGVLLRRRWQNLLNGQMRTIHANWSILLQAQIAIPMYSGCLISFHNLK